LSVGSLIFGVRGISSHCLETILNDFGAFSESILRVLAINALMVKLLARGFEFMQHFQHVLIGYLA
jgi:hypothetical protein